MSFEEKISKRKMLESELRSLQQEVDLLTEQVSVPKSERQRHGQVIPRDILVSNNEEEVRDRLKSDISAVQLTDLEEDNAKLKSQLDSIRNERYAEIATTAEERKKEKYDLAQHAREVFSSPASYTDFETELDSELEDIGIDLQQLRLEGNGSPDTTKTGTWGGDWKRKSNEKLVGVGAGAKIIRAKRALADMTQQRDAALDRVQKAEKEAERLKDQLRQADHALRLLSDLQKDYELLKQSFEASEKVRLKQKEMIHNLRLEQTLQDGESLQQEVRRKAWEEASIGRFRSESPTRLRLSNGFEEDPISAASARIEKTLARSPCLTKKASSSSLPQPVNKISILSKQPKKNSTHKKANSKQKNGFSTVASSPREALPKSRTVKGAFISQDSRKTSRLKKKALKTSTANLKSDHTSQISLKKRKSKSKNTKTRKQI